MDAIGTVAVKNGLTLLAMGCQTLVHKENIVQGITEMTSDPVLHSRKPWPGMFVT